MSFLIVDNHPTAASATADAGASPAVESAPPLAEQGAKAEKKKKKEKPPIDPRLFATPVDAIQRTRSVSAKTEVVIPTNATRFADVAVQLTQFQGQLDKLLAFTTRQGGQAFLSAAISCAPWLGAIAMLIATSGVGVAVCLGAGGLLRTARPPRNRYLPVDAAMLAKLRKAYDVAAADADPIGATALRHTVVKALERAKESRGLGPEAELYLLDLRYTADADPEVAAVASRAAETAAALSGPNYSPKVLPELHPYEAVALSKRYPRPADGYRDQTYEVVRQAGDRAQDQIDAAVSADIARRLNPEER